MIEFWWIIIAVIVSVVLAAVATFFIVKKIFEKQMEKNPPINPAMIRALYTSMGRKPSESQIKNVMRSVKKHKK